MRICAIVPYLREILERPCLYACVLQRYGKKRWVWNRFPQGGGGTLCCCRLASEQLSPNETMRLLFFFQSDNTKGMFDAQTHTHTRTRALCASATDFHAPCVLVSFSVLPTRMDKDVWHTVVGWLVPAAPILDASQHPCRGAHTKPCPLLTTHNRRARRPRPFTIGHAPQQRHTDAHTQQGHTFWVAAEHTHTHTNTYSTHTHIPSRSIKRWCPSPMCPALYLHGWDH